MLKTVPPIIAKRFNKLLEANDTTTKLGMNLHCYYPNGNDDYLAITTGTLEQKDEHNLVYTTSDHHNFMVIRDMLLKFIKYQIISEAFDKPITANSGVVVDHCLNHTLIVLDHDQQTGIIYDTNSIYFYRDQQFYEI